MFLFKYRSSDNQAMLLKILKENGYSDIQIGSLIRKSEMKFIGYEKI